jgi:hypothetical protein
VFSWPGPPRCPCNKCNNLSPSVIRPHLSGEEESRLSLSLLSCSSGRPTMSETGDLGDLPAQSGDLGDLGPWSPGERGDFALPGDLTPGENRICQMFKSDLCHRVAWPAHGRGWAGLGWPRRQGSWTAPSRGRRRSPARAPRDPSGAGRRPSGNAGSGSEPPPRTLGGERGEKGEWRLK